MTAVQGSDPTTVVKADKEEEKVSSSLSVVVAVEPVAMSLSTLDNTVVTDPSSYLTPPPPDYDDDDVIRLSNNKKDSDYEIRQASACLTELLAILGVSPNEIESPNNDNFVVVPSAKHQESTFVAHTALSEQLSP